MPAIDQAFLEGVEGKLHSSVDLMEELHAQIPPDHDAASFLAAGLHLAGRDVLVDRPDQRNRWLSRFEADPLQSQPIGFYTWSQELRIAWRFKRFFQTPLMGDDTDIVVEIVRVLNENPSLLADYDRQLQLYSKLTNPYTCLSLRDVLGLPSISGDLIRALCEERGIRQHAVAVFPVSTTREQILFETLFPFGLPANANLMRELFRRIRSGEVDLTPTENSGWYEHQVYALETLLLPEKGEEREKLLLSLAYKKRMLDAFKALLTKRRETHSANTETTTTTDTIPEVPSRLVPRLRVEPAPSYYLRTARSYAFLRDVLLAALGDDVLAALHGRTKDGIRPLTLAAELDYMRDLFYGLYLVSAEDIGLKTSLKPGEVASEDECYALAVEWLHDIYNDPDLAQDTRVAIPIAVDPNRNVTRLWLTLGVRLTKLNARFAKPPSLRPRNGSQDWLKPESLGLIEFGEVNYVIAVDEFAEVELPGRVSLTREQLREICDQARTREAIIAALRNR